MRIIGLLTMSVWLSACSTGPMFPPAIMRDVEANTFDAKAWEDQAYHPSSGTFIPHKVELAGGVIQRSDHLVILAEEKPLEAHPTSSPPASNLTAHPGTRSRLRGL